VLPATTQLLIVVDLTQYIADPFAALVLPIKVELLMVIALELATIAPPFDAVEWLFVKIHLSTKKTPEFNITAPPPTDEPNAVLALLDVKVQPVTLTLFDGVTEKLIYNAPPEADEVFDVKLQFEILIGSCTPALI
jgi:hypothetical protein